MQKKILALIIVIINLLALTGCIAKDKNRYEAEFLQLFDTVTIIVGYTETKEEFEGYSKMIYNSLEEYHKLYDIYNTYEGINNIKTINDNAGTTPVKVNKKIIDLLLFSKDAYELSEGKANIALGSVLKIWHDYREEGIDDPLNAKLPSQEELINASNHTDIEKIIIDEVDSTVYLSDPEMKIDVGAIAKGYATEQVAKTVYDAGLTSAIISVGGNIRTIGSKADTGDRWIVGIQNPDVEADNKTIYSLKLKDQSLVTSGNYQRYYTVEGVKYHHLINPDTLMPADYFKSVSIVCEDSGMADVMSTAAYVLPYQESKELIEGVPDTEAVWFFTDGTIKYSTGFEKYMKKD